MTAARRRILIIMIVLLGLVDLGRSLYARVGSATATRLWSPDPAYARPIAWPPGSDLASDAPVGARVYARHCAVCHGPDGHGNGPAAPALYPRPRDFTRGIFKLKSTPESDAPLLADVRATIEQGMPGSSMLGWHDLVTEASIDAVAEYVRDFGAQHTWANSDAAIQTSSQLLENASVERGRDAYVELGCPACHGKEGRGDGSSATALQDVWNQPDPPRDLTAPWTFRGGSTPPALFTRVANGLSGTPMPGYADVATPQQLADVVSYIGSIARTPAWEPGGSLDGPGTSGDPVRRGEYLVRAGMCGLCHTPVDPNGIYLADSHYLAGGMKIEAGAHGIFFAPNLTSDTESGLGQWTVEQIAIAIRTGHTRTRRLNYWGMPWMVLGALTPDDASAIAAYLKTLPAVRNYVPLSLHYGVVETVARKLTYGWPAVVPERLSYFAGNYGYEQPVAWPRDRLQRLLARLQMAILLLGLLAFVFAPSSERGGGLMMAVSLFVLVIAAVLGLVDRYPALNLVPAEAVVSVFSATVPEPQTAGLPAHTAALVQRGRYLYGIASCPYCHGGNGSGGGKVNWGVFGTTWAANLTAHPSGLADWSDDAVLRAMSGGVSRDGRSLHWQAMIWDHISNYSLEDQHALLTYIRTLPPIDRSAPHPVAPRSDDCAGDTFWVGSTNSEPGCL